MSIGTPFESALRNWAIVSYKDDTGLGRMAEDARRVLGIGYQVVVPSRRLSTKNLEAGDFLLAHQNNEALRDFLAERDGLIVLEKADWTPELLPMAKELRLAVAAVPMWEWFRADDPLWKLCDLFACPNRKCFEVVTAAGYQNALEIPWALDLSRFPKRNVSGLGRFFIHNAGLVDTDDRKGTCDVIEAFRRVQNPDARLVVRLQAAAPLPELDSRIELRVGNVADVSELWSSGDVAIQPSKMEGIGFTVLEPICAGLPVITLDAAPMNEYPAGFLVKPRWLKRKAFASQWVREAHLRLPSPKHLTKAIENAAAIDLADVSCRQRAWAEEMFDAKVLRQNWKNALLPLVRQRRAPRMNEPVSVSACIPCFNAEGTLARAARGIRGQSVKVRELVVVDDGSTDGSIQVAQRVGDRSVRFATNLGRGSARQRGIEELDDEFILFCDAGLELPPIFVGKALAHFTSDRVAAVFGIVSDPDARSFCDRWRNRHLFKASVKEGLCRNASLMTGGALLKRSAIAEAGGFNPSLAAGEDQDLGERLLKAGYEVICDPELRLRPLRRDSVLQLLRRYARWNRAPGYALSWREYAKSVAYHSSLARRDLVAADLPCTLLTLIVPHYLFWSRRSAASQPHSGASELKAHSVVKAA